MKPLAGKRAFYRMGQRALYACTFVRVSQWPEWAQRAYQQGYDDERLSKARMQVKTWSIAKLAESVQ
jgi:hypothetical protein